MQMSGDLSENWYDCGVPDFQVLRLLATLDFDTVEGGVWWMEREKLKIKQK